MTELEFIADITETMPLEQFLRHEKGISRRLLTRCKRLGSLTCNGVPIRTVDPIHPQDCIRLTAPEREGTVVPNTALTAPMLYEDAHMVIYNKPADMPAHPSHGHYTDTLGNVFTAAFPELPFRCITRLDRDTSGVCIVAKSAYAAAYLQQQTLQKTYLAIVCGKISTSGTVNAPIARQQDSVITRCVRADGKPAVTHYEPVVYRNNMTLVRLRLETGRTHQIRVHMAHIGHPLLGDTLYGTASPYIQRQALHCAQVTFETPADSISHTVTAPIPEDMAAQFPDF